MSKPEDSGLERDYCAGLLSLRDMAEIYGISEGAIRKRAKKNGWVRNKPEGTQKSTQVRKTGTQKKEVRTVSDKPTKKKKNTQETQTDLSDNDEEENLLSPELSVLSARELIFVQEVNAGAKLIQAFLKAGYENNPKTAYKEASRLVRKPHIAKALRFLQTQRLERYTVELDEIVHQLVAITRADPNLLTQYRRVNCRHCWGEFHFYQWRDAAEFEERKLEAKERKRREPTDAGGYGFDSTLAPNPDCPRCNGEGVGEMVMGDTRDLDVNEHTYFLGIKQTKNGIEAITESKQIARAQLLKILEIKAGRKNSDPLVGEEPREDDDLTDEQLHDALQELGYGRRRNQLEEKLDDS